MLKYLQPAFCHLGRTKLFEITLKLTIGNYYFLYLNELRPLFSNVCF